MLISTTLTGNSEAIIGDAIRSVVEWVDRCLVIDTGVTDRTLEIAREIAGAKYIERKYTWSNDFAAARNFALDAAYELGGDWAVTVDSDERLQLRGEALDKAFATPNIACWMVLEESGNYPKERFFRLPVGARYRGPTHEAFPAYEIGYGVLPRLRFTELKKTPEQYRAKFERDVRVLGDYTKEHPSDPRWHYYLGDSLQNLERFEEAIAAFDRCASLRGWNEESAWACYRAADCCTRLERWQDAVDFCARGLALHSGIAELAWLAGYASYRAGRVDQAIFWSQTSIAMGLYKGFGASVHRIGFRNPMALWEGPYDVLRWTHKQTGDANAQKEAERLFAEAKAARERGGNKPTTKPKKRRRRS